MNKMDVEAWVSDPVDGWPPMLQHPVMEAVKCEYRLDDRLKTKRHCDRCNQRFNSSRGHAPRDCQHCVPHVYRGNVAKGVITLSRPHGGRPTYSAYDVINNTHKFRRATSS